MNDDYSVAGLTKADPNAIIETDFYVLATDSIDRVGLFSRVLKQSDENYTFSAEI